MWFHITADLESYQAQGLRYMPPKTLLILPLTLTLFNSSLVQELIDDLLNLINEISKEANKKKEWKSLQEELHELVHKIISNECPYECYKMNILKSAVIPYIRQMHRRLILNQKRFHQIQIVLRILSKPLSKDEHPSNLLQEIETIVSSVDAEGGWWKSEFASKMQHAVALEWMPILSDNRLVSHSHSHPKTH